MIEFKHGKQFSSICIYVDITETEQLQVADVDNFLTLNKIFHKLPFKLSWNV